MVHCLWPAAIVAPTTYGVALATRVNRNVSLKFIVVLSEPPPVCRTKH
jgi:hypothetical protein